MVNIFNKDNRRRIQLLGLIAFNGNLKGFFNGKIYRGPVKGVCVPVLNCYSCPGALGACPIGSLQAVAGYKNRINFYVIGLLVLFGITMGRFFCGFLCPFGLLQDILYKIRSVKIKVQDKYHNVLKYLKYFNLAILTVALPVFVSFKKGYADPYFCKYICPAGILEGAVPLMIKNRNLVNAVGYIFSWKVFLALLFIVFSVFIYRFFCKYICPLGAFYGLFNGISVYRLEVDGNKCIKCGKCSKVCKMHIDPYKTPNSPECIRCLDCKSVCPTDAIDNAFKFSEERKNG